MWLKPRVNDQLVEKAPGQLGASIYWEAYNYALDLCKNPEIAREVASRFVKYLGLEVRQQTSPEPELGKA